MKLSNAGSESWTSSFDSSSAACVFRSLLKFSYYLSRFNYDNLFLAVVASRLTGLALTRVSQSLIFLVAVDVLVLPIAVSAMSCHLPRSAELASVYWQEKV